MTKNIGILFAFMMLNTSVIHAQFFKKLIKKATKSAERTIERKVEQKTEKETSDVFDKTIGDKRKSRQKSGASLRETYSFSHEYILEVENHRGRKTKMIYYLSNQNPYICTTIPNQENIKTVVDFHDRKMYMFMHNGQEKTLMSYNLKMNTFSEVADDINVVLTGNTRIINGFSCKEYKIEGPDYNGTAWVTKDVGISFNDAFYKFKMSGKKMGKKMFMKKINGLLMESTITDTSSRRPKTLKSKCVGINKNSLVIKSRDYKSIL